LLVLRLVELFKTTVQDFAFELRDAFDELGGKSIKQKSDKLKGGLRHVDILILEDNSHEILHSVEVVRVDSDRQMLLLLFPVGVGRNIGVGDLFLYIFLLLIDEKERLSEDGHLSQSQLGKLLGVGEVVAKQVTQMVFVELVEQIHKKQLLLFRERIVHLCNVGKDCLVGCVIYLRQRF
jgi:hypothetical protein